MKGGDKMEGEKKATCADRIKRALQIKGMKQTDLCQITKIPKSAISQYISGAFEPKQDRIRLISNALNVSEAWLMGYDVPMSNDRKIARDSKMYCKIISDMIKSKMQEESLTVDDVAELIALPVADVEDFIECKATCDQDTMSIISMSPLFAKKNTPEEPKLSEGEGVLLDLFRRIPQGVRIRPIKRKKLPKLGNVACGDPIYADEDITYVDADDVDADFCLTAQGDSMVNARIFDGDLLFVKKAEMVDDGQIAVVLIGDEATVKRVYYDRENNILTLVPENPVYKPMRYTGAQLENIRIVGRVVMGQYAI